MDGAPPEAEVSPGDEGPAVRSQEAAGETVDAQAPQPFVVDPPASVPDPEAPVTSAGGETGEKEGLTTVITPADEAGMPPQTATPVEEAEVLAAGQGSAVCRQDVADATVDSQGVSLETQETPETQAAGSNEIPGAPGNDGAPGVAPTDGEAPAMDTIPTEEKQETFVAPGTTGGEPVSSLDTREGGESINSLDTREAPTEDAAGAPTERVADAPDEKTEAASDAAAIEDPRASPGPSSSSPDVTSFEERPQAGSPDVPASVEHPEAPAPSAAGGELNALATAPPEAEVVQAGEGEVEARPVTVDSPETQAGGSTGIPAPPGNDCAPGESPARPVTAAEPPEAEVVQAGDGFSELEVEAPVIASELEVEARPVTCAADVAGTPLEDPEATIISAGGETEGAGEKEGLAPATAAADVAGMPPQILPALEDAAVLAADAVRGQDGTPAGETVDRQAPAPQAASSNDLEDRVQDGPASGAQDAATMSDGSASVPAVEAERAGAPQDAAGGAEVRSEEDVAPVLLPSDGPAGGETADSQAPARDAAGVDAFVSAAPAVEVRSEEDVGEAADREAPERGAGPFVAAAPAVVDPSALGAPADVQGGEGFSELEVEARPVTAAVDVVGDPAADDASLPESLAERGAYPKP